jgi:endonuclease YncB( thermonuclease family)
MCLLRANLNTVNLRKFVTRCLWILFVFGLTTTLLADELRGKVVSIADGDTITVLDADKKQHKVRLTGIDAPEKKQAFGAKSKARLGELFAKFQTGFYADPVDAVFKALGVQ